MVKRSAQHRVSKLGPRLKGSYIDRVILNKLLIGWGLVEAFHGLSDGPRQRHGPNTRPSSWSDISVLHVGIRMGLRQEELGFKVTA